MTYKEIREKHSLNTDTLATLFGFKSAVSLRNNYLFNYKGFIEYIYPILKGRDISKIMMHLDYVESLTSTLEKENKSIKRIKKAVEELHKVFNS